MLYRLSEQSQNSNDIRPKPRDNSVTRLLPENTFFGSWRWRGYAPVVGGGVLIALTSSVQVYKGTDNILKVYKGTDNILKIIFKLLDEKQLPLNIEIDLFQFEWFGIFGGKAGSQVVVVSTVVTNEC